MRQGAVAVNDISTGIAHLLLGADRDAWEACRASCQAEDVVVVLDAGVMALADPAVVESFPCPVWVSEPDLLARGLPVPSMGASQDAGIAGLVDDSRVIKLLASHRQSLSWR